MNSDEIWLLQLWSGVFGVVIGAAGAAGVAMLVLRKTNEHQSDLAAQAMDTQRKIAMEAMTEQRANAETALEQQRTALELQLREQRMEASRAREIAALADMIPALGDLTLAAMDLRDETKLTPLAGRLQAVAARWWMELDRGPMKTEMYRFPLFLHSLAERTVMENEPQVRAEWLGKLATAAGILRSGVMDWPRASDEERLDIARRLTACRHEFDDIAMFDGA